jgi:hypothetical protein
MKRVSVGTVVSVTLPWSEVCMHLSVAGQTRPVEVLATGAQILNEDGTPYSFPVTHGEAGIYRDADGLYIQEEV